MPSSISKFHKTWLAQKDTTRSALVASSSHMTFLKRSLGGQKVFVFSSIPPGNALHTTVGRFIFTYRVTTARNPRDFSFHLS